MTIVIPLAPLTLLRCLVSRPKRYHLRLLVTAFILSNASLGCGPGQIHVPRPNYTGRVGMGISHTLVGEPATEIEAELKQIRAGGVSWVREDFPWATAEPAKGVFNWAPLDHLMEAASLADVHMLAILDYSALWASSDPSGHGDIFYPPKHDVDFATYAAAVASRYGVHGTFWSEHAALKADPLTAVEIWNEPYGSWFWKPRPDPLAYVALVRQAALAIHRAKRHMFVLMSGDLQSFDGRNATSHYRPWLESLLAADPSLPRLVDGFAVHPYAEPRETGPYGTGFSPAQSFGRVALIRKIALNAGIAKPIWITEVGWSTSPRAPHAISDATQATYMREAISRAIGEWGSYVQKIFLFSWYRSDGIPNSVRNYGLLDRSGIPKPAWRAITALIGSS